MLLELKVKNIGIIDELCWTPGRGFNVITGETGAGKSLVVDALDALLSGKLEEEAIRHNAEESQVEGIFDLPSGCLQGIRSVLEERGITLEEDEPLALSCRLQRGGRSIVRINGQAAPRSVIRQIEHLIVDIHGQSEHLSLLDRNSHRDFLDACAHTMSLRDEFAEKAGQLRQAEQQLSKLLAAERERAKREDFLRFQVGEIADAKLHPGEDEELEQERNVVAFSERLKELSYEAYAALTGDNTASDSSSVLDLLGSAVQSVDKLVEIDASLAPQQEYLSEMLSGLQEMARDIHQYSDQLEYDPHRLEEIEGRLEVIRNLKRKYGATIEEILEQAEKAAGELDSLAHSQEKKDALEQQCTALKRELGNLGAELSRRRAEAAEILADAVQKELADLDMQSVVFRAEIRQTESEEGIPLPDGRICAYTETGIDEIEFMAATNPGEPLKPLHKIASTGEISRFMLALKSALAGADSTPVLVFDEIDIGVGGRSGEKLGMKLWNLAQNRQVLCITHLPQIAAFADGHYTVQKSTEDEHTTSRLTALEKDTQCRELAAMLAGSRYSKTALDNARELKQKADDWKSGHRMLL